MQSHQQLHKSQISKLTQSESIELLSLDKIFSLFIEEFKHNIFNPKPVYHIDPRNCEPVLFNPARSARPHTYASEQQTLNEPSCPICKGETTGIIDIAYLSDGFTFVNKNRYPVILPDQTKQLSSQDQQQNNAIGWKNGRLTAGLHLLQWTSSYHNQDWYNMPIEDCVIVMKRLAVIERKFILYKTEDSTSADGVIKNFFVSIIKNAGRMVGGSLDHGHQQIVVSNIMPRRTREHSLFTQQQGQNFASYLLMSNPSTLMVKDYERAILLVPYFMRRPFNMMLIPKDTAKSFVHELDDQEIREVSKGWQDAILALRNILPTIGREVAYNVITHNGHGGGLYFEFLPFSQEFGGLEQLGLTICQADPLIVARTLKETISDLN